MVMMRRILLLTLVASSFINNAPTYTFDYQQTCQNCIAYAKPYVQKLTGTVIESHFWEKPLFWGALCTAGTTIALIAYYNRFNLNDAHNLVTEINEFNEYAHMAYNREFELLTNKEIDANSKDTLNTIILQIVSPTPYLDYANKAQQNLERCQIFYKRITNGVVKLNIAYNKAVANTITSTLLLDEYETVIQELSILQKNVCDLADFFGKLCTICWQNNECKQEMVYAELKQLTHTMDRIEMNTLLHNLSHNTTIIYNK
jgi:hypothetical protein